MSNQREIFVTFLLTSKPIQTTSLLSIGSRPQCVRLHQLLRIGSHLIPVAPCTALLAPQMDQ